MKKLILIITLSLYSFAQSQENSDIVKYSAATFTAILYNSNNEIVNQKIVGKNVKIYFDKVFKSYIVEFENEDNNLTKYKFIFIKNLGANVMQMETHQGKSVKIIDELSDGGLIIINDKFDDGTWLSYGTSRATKLN
jgi:hypothetical protein